MLNKEMSALQLKIRMIYYCAYMIACAAMYCVPLRDALAGYDGLVFDGVIFTALGFVGVGLIVWDFFTGRSLFQIPYADILVAFFAACMIGIVINRQYSFFSNIKGLVLVALQTFLFAAIITRTRGKCVLKWFHILADVFIAIWLAGVVWSLGQYCVQYADVRDLILGLGGAVQTQRVGFMQGRLFGIFMDPNYASVCSLIAIALSAGNLISANRPRLVKGYYILSIILQIFYVVLSGSRTGSIAGVVVAAFCAAFLLTKRFGRPHQAKHSGKVNGGLFLTVGALSVLILFGGYRVTQTALSYVPGLVSSVAESLEQTDEPNVQTTPGSSAEPTVEPDVQTTPGSSADGEDGHQHQGNTSVDLNRTDVTESDDITNHRLTIWSDCLELVKATPWFGTTSRGYMEWAKKLIPDSFLVARGYSAHNGYLMLLMATGVIGFGIMMVWMGLIVWKVLSYLIRRWDSRDEYYWPVYICAMVLAMIAIAAFPLQSIFFSHDLADTMFWLLLGFAMCFMRCSEPEKNQSSGLMFRLLEKLFQKKESRIKGA